MSGIGADLEARNRDDTSTYCEVSERRVRPADGERATGAFRASPSQRNRPSVTTGLRGSGRRSRRNGRRDPRHGARRCRTLWVQPPCRRAYDFCASDAQVDIQIGQRVEAGCAGAADPAWAVPGRPTWPEGRSGPRRLGPRRRSRRRPRSHRSLHSRRPCAEPSAARPCRSTVHRSSRRRWA